MNLQDLFTVTSLTDAINKLPVAPNKAAKTGLFLERGVTTTNVTIENLDGHLRLVQSTSRNADPVPVKLDKRKRRTFEIPHLPTTAQILPSEIQSIASFGSDAALNPAANPQVTVINDKLAGMKSWLDQTREWQRMGGIAGQILDADGSIIYDLYNEFGIVKKAGNIKFSTVGLDVRGELLKRKRAIEKAAPSLLITGWKAFVGPDFFDALTGHDSVKAAYANWQAAQDRLAGDMRTGFRYADIDFEEYNWTISGRDFVAPNKCRLFPVAQDMFRMYNAPANYNETVNTIGLPFYAKAEERRMGKGWDLEAQSNPLAMCLYPETLDELTAT
jgi:hypothetical protein